MESGKFMVRIIAKRDDGALLATKSDTATINSIDEKGMIISSNGAYLSPLLPIGTLTKSDNWEECILDFSYEGNIVTDALIGLAVGDAYGVPFEFMRRSEVRRIGAKKMVGNGSHSVPIGSFSDDTSMTVAAIDSIINDKSINYNHIMDNYLLWLNEDKFTSNDYTFGVGNTIYNALNNYQNGLEALNCGKKGFMDNGNGSLMRILPFSLYCILNNIDTNETKKIIGEASSLTHAHDISKLSCYIYTEFLREIINTKNPEMALQYIETLDLNGFSEESIGVHKRILSNFINVEDSEINESGYVVDTLEAALYSVLNSYDYESAIICATEMGHDTDTIAAITGSIAGIVYGYNSIPKEWLLNLKRREYLEDMATKYAEILDNIRQKHDKMI